VFKRIFDIKLISLIMVESRFVGFIFARFFAWTPFTCRILSDICSIIYLILRFEGQDLHCYRHIVLESVWKPGFINKAVRRPGE